MEEQLKKWLEWRLKKLEEQMKINFERNKGLNGKTIATINGQVREAYLKGKIELINFLLAEKYKKEETK